jgi:hypothetical protein
MAQIINTLIIAVALDIPDWFLFITLYQKYIAPPGFTAISKKATR